MSYLHEQLSAFVLGPTKCDRCPFSAPFGGLCPGGGTASACTERTLNPSQADFDAQLAGTRGLDLGVTIARPQPRIGLPRFVPPVDGSAIGQRLERPWVAIRLTDWLKRSHVAQPLGIEMLPGLNIDSRAKVLLLLFANDFVLEGKLWPGRHRFLDTLETWKPDAVAGPDFSVWEDDSWIERQFSMVRSVRFFELLQDHGIAAIPHVAWGDRGQMGEWVRWLAANQVELISMDLQCLQPSIRGQFRSELATFRDALGIHPGLLVGGTTDEQWLRSILGVWPEASFSANVTLLAHKRRRTDQRRDGSATRVMVERGDPADLLLREVERIEAMLEGFMTIPWASKFFNSWGTLGPVVADLNRQPYTQDCSLSADALSVRTSRRRRPHAANPEFAAHAITRL